MIVTIREYEKDPSLLMIGRDNDDGDNGVASSSVSVPVSLVDNDESVKNLRHEYVLKTSNEQATIDEAGSSSSSVGGFSQLEIQQQNVGVQSSSSSSSPSIGFASNFENRLYRVFVHLFLPLGYPQSVDPTYLPYQLYDGLQGLCSYWRGVVTTRAVLEAAGVGNAEATATSAALQWALRDGTGMLGGLWFSYIASHKFDTHVKEFRLFADVINDVALTLDMVAPMVGTKYSLYVLSLSTIGKTLCGMSAGATKGRITQHFSRHGNMADLSAKESTQETLVSLLGMMGGVAVAQLLQHLPYEWTWIMFGILTLVHVWANYQAVMLLKLTTLNPERTSVVLNDILNVLVVDGNDKELEVAMQRIPTPENVNESLLSSTKNLLFPTLHVARPLDPQKLQYLSEFAEERYLIGSSDGQYHFYCWLRVGATDQDELQAYIHATVLQAKVLKGQVYSSDLVKSTLIQARKLFSKESSFSRNDLWQLLEEQGWDLQSRLYLGFSSYRVEWTIKDD